MLLVHNCLHNENERSKEQVFGKLKSEQQLEGKTNLEVGIASEDVRDHHDDCENRHQYCEQNRETQQFSKEQGPVSHRSCVDVLAHACVAFAPDQLTRKVDDDQWHDEAVIR